MACRNSWSSKDFVTILHSDSESIFQLWTGVKFLCSYNTMLCCHTHVQRLTYKVKQHKLHYHTWYRNEPLVHTLDKTVVSFISKAASLLENNSSIKNRVLAQQLHNPFVLWNWFVLFLVMFNATDICEWFYIIINYYKIKQTVSESYYCFCFHRKSWQVYYRFVWRKAWFHEQDRKYNPPRSWYFCEAFTLLWIERR